MLLMAASRVLRTAASTVSPTLGRARRYVEPSGGVSAAPELERLKLQLALEKAKAAQALALEKEKAAQRAHELALEDKKAAHALALEDKKAAQSRGVWEAVFGIKRETAQLLNLGAGGVFFFASGAYLVSAMLSNVWAHTLVAVSKSEAVSQDVRAFMTNAQPNLVLCNYHDNLMSAWLQDDGKTFAPSGVGANKCRGCVSVHNAARKKPTEERQPQLILLLHRLLDVLDEEELEVLESKLDFVNFKACKLREAAKELGWTHCKSHPDPDGSPDGSKVGIWFLDATAAEQKSNRCTACARGLTNPAAYCIHVIVAGAFRRAHFELVNGRWRRRAVPRPFDKGMLVKATEFFAPSNVRDSCLGVPYVCRVGTFFSPSVDSIFGKGYGPDLRLPDGTMQPQYRFGMKAFNVAWSDKQNWSDEDGLIAIMSFKRRATVLLWERIEAAKAAPPGSTAAAFLLRPEVAALCADAAVMQALEDDYDVYQLESFEHKQTFMSWYTKGHRNFNAELYRKTASMWSANIQGDMIRMKKNTSMYSSFKTYALPLLEACGGRDAISDAPLSDFGQWRASFNRMLRDPGHVPANLEVTAHFTNHSGNARAVKDDVLNRKRMVEICLLTNRVQLTAVEALALRVL